MLPWVDLIDLLGASREILCCYPLLVAATRSPVFQLIFWCHVQESFLANLVPNMAQLGTQNGPKWSPRPLSRATFFHLGRKPKNEQHSNGFACFSMSRENPFLLKIGVWTEHIIQLGFQASCELLW